MKRLFLSSLFLFGLSVAGSSSASVIFGNPIVDIILDSGPPVFIGAVQGQSCPGQETVWVSDTLTTSASLSATLSEDDWCTMTILVKWTSSSSWDNVPVDGFTTFTTEEDEVQRSIVLYPSSRTASLE